MGEALTSRGAAIMGWMVSPIRGAQGNVEFFVHARGRGGARQGVSGASIEDVLAEAVEP